MTIETSYQISLLFIYFFIYAVLGWLCEVIYCSVLQHRLVNRGYLTGPYCPIYGVGAMLLLELLAPYINNPVSVFCVGVFATSTLEYITSWGMEKLFHAKWWDYSNKKFNLEGRVCLLNSTLFGILCLVLIYLIHPIVSDLVQNIPVFWLIVTAIILLIGFMTDVVISTVETINLQKKMAMVSEKISAVSDELIERGVQTREELALKLEDTRKMANALRTDTIESVDELELRLNTFAKELQERTSLSRYSHRRIVDAFPHLRDVADPSSVPVYRNAMKRNRHIKRIRNQIKNK